MSPIFIAFLVLFIPGLIMIALVVAVALPRAVRDEKRQRQQQRGEGDQ